jgi:hypothetical protein
MGFHGLYYSIIVGANGIRLLMIQINFPIVGIMVLVAVRSFISPGFNVNLALPSGSESRILRITGFHGRIEDVFGLSPMVILRGLLFTLLFADALRIGESPGNESTI